MILNQVAEQAEPTALGNKAAARAIRCLRKIHNRFGRTEEIKSADLRLSAWLAQNR